MKKYIVTGNFILVIALLMAGNALANTNAVGTIQQTVCPIMGGDIKKDIFADYNGKRVYFCCNSCVGPFRENPAKYIKMLETDGVILEQSSETNQQDNHEHRTKKADNKLNNRKSGCGCCGS